MTSGSTCAGSRVWRRKALGSLEPCAQQRSRFLLGAMARQPPGAIAAPGGAHGKGRYYPGCKSSGKGLAAGGLLIACRGPKFGLAAGYNARRAGDDIASKLGERVVVVA